MGGIVKSAGGFLGFDTGDKAPAGNFNNSGLDLLNSQNRIYNGDFGVQTNKDLQGYGNGQMSLQQTMDDFNTSAGHGNLAGGQTGEAFQGFANALATNPLTGSKFAADQLQQNPVSAGLYGEQGQLGKAEGKLNGLYDQGFNLTPEDQTMYGQMSGDIARQFGQQGNKTASSLASRGLSNSGAAGAAFSGLAGSQNEQLAQAQQSIAQQRYQNTMHQIGQYQNFVQGMGGQYNQALQNQYGRQLSGVQNQQDSAIKGAGLQAGQNNSQNDYAMQSAKYNTENTPTNVMDFATAGLGQGIQAAASGGVASATGGGSKPKSLFGG